MPDTLTLAQRVKAFLDAHEAAQSRYEPIEMTFGARAAWDVPALVKDLAAEVDRLTKLKELASVNWDGHYCQAMTEAFSENQEIATQLFDAKEENARLRDIIQRAERMLLRYTSETVREVLQEADHD